MEISQLRYFLALCDQRSFTRAAEQCGVSQPSLSNAIMALEEELGGPLIRRSPFELTALGKAVRPQFRSALRHIRQASKIAAIQSTRQGDIPGTQALKRPTRAGIPINVCNFPPQQKSATHENDADLRASPR